jgi:hypothetical protein
MSKIVNGGQKNMHHNLQLEIPVSVGCQPHMPLESLPKIKRLPQSDITNALLRQLTCLLKVKKKEFGKNQKLIN